MHSLSITPSTQRHITPARTLRLALRADATASALLGLGLVGATTPFAHELGLGTGLTAGLGVFLLAYAALLLGLQAREHLHRGWILLIVIGNLAWALDTLLAPWLGLIQPTGWGLALIVGQALVVAGFAVWQALGLRVSQPLHR